MGANLRSADAAVAVRLAGRWNDARLRLAHGPVDVLTSTIFPTALALSSLLGDCHRRLDRQTKGSLVTKSVKEYIPT